MRARRLLAFFGVVALAVAALVVLRSGDSEPMPDGVGSVSSQPNAPPALRAPGLAPSPMPTPAAPPRKPVDPAPVPEAPNPRTARIEGPS